MTYAQAYLEQVIEVAAAIKPFEIEQMVSELVNLRDRNGTLYIIGLGGSAANASHMSADIRKLCDIHATSLDNLAEVTARANDEGFETIFEGFLKRINKNDAIFILSVGGGTDEVSLALLPCLTKAKVVTAKILGIVGHHGGYTAKYGDCVIKIPCPSNVTPHTESFQAVIWHCLVSHPLLQRVNTKW